ncbi:DEAD/DEAH box helicase [Aliarcobacter butzleri]|uniref:DEAD/DEAH box helicase n=1 Tax=Aliarcobacter butzleri TaxID=28197 RepID=UPI001EDD7F4C|nr:DEAD/DEAH box helicase [Aliarcobacter butzleri]MCG3695472.1 DEAD/DEAH box helicase [Aliarcobacter butzleri]
MIIEHINRVLDKTDSTNSNIVDILHIQSQIELNKRLLTNDTICFGDKKIEDIHNKADILTSLCILIHNEPKLQEELADYKRKNKKDLLGELYSVSYEIYKILFEKTNEISYLIYSVMYSTLADKLPLVNQDIEKFLGNYYVNEQNLLLKFKENICIAILKIYKLIKDKASKDDLSLSISNLDTLTYEIQSTNLDNLSIQDSFYIAGLSNINYILKKVSTYLLTGENKDNIYTVINTYTFNTIKLLNNIDKDLLYIVKILQVSMQRLCRNSIWNLTEKSPLIKHFFHKLIEEENSFIYSLLPSQRETINNILTSKKSIVLNMPTSSGKTLISQISILYTLQNYTDTFTGFKPTICYVVPTNALINQVAKKFKNDFKSINLNVETVLPFNDIDKFEDYILNAKHIDILISTPEKLDFLIRNEHPSLNNLKQVIVDEAHNISEETRGSKFELLLASIKLLRSDVNFLLMSPFIKNAKDIAVWLGSNEQDSLPISIEWSPTKQYMGCNIINSRQTTSKIKYFPTPTNNIVKEEIDIDLYNSPILFKEEIGEERIDNIVKSLIILKRYTKIGGTVLVLMQGAGSAEKLAIKSLSYFRNNFENISAHPLIQKLQTIIDLEMDENHILKETINYGIAFHHAKLPNIVKEGIEELISSGLIRILCATTTLAQGMNFPITTVLFDSLNVGGGSSSRELTNSEFWNIAGRAGRAYMDKEGHIIIKMLNSKRSTIDKTKSLIYDRTQTITSSLAKFFDELKEYNFNYELIKDNPAIQNFLQYINHILRVSYKYNLTNVDTSKIRNILETSLVFQESSYEEGFFETQEKFSNFSKRYIDSLKGKDTTRLTIADTLGITNISLETISGLTLNHIKNIKEIYGVDRVSEYTNATKIILDSQSNDKLAPIVEIISRIPEIKLSLTGHGSFQAEQVAKLIISWVNGKKINDIANEIRYENESYEKILNMCYQYVNSTMTSFVPWGMSIYQQITNDKENEAENLPSYIYYGVNDFESLIFAKIGIPRSLVNNIKETYKKKYPTDLISIENIEIMRNKILNYSDTDFKLLNKNPHIIKSIIKSKL